MSERAAASAAFRREREHRRALRARISVRVECKTPRIFIQGFAENISETGMLVSCRETFEVSQTVTIRFELPANRSTLAVSSAAIVARAERGRLMGLHFIGLRPAFQHAIAEYIERTGRARPAPEAQPS